MVNISSRVRVQSGDNALFGGFIITGSTPKRILLRAIGPSLKSGNSPIPGRLDNPTIELFDKDRVSLETNDDWKDSANRAEIESSGFAPADDRESVIVRTVNPGQFTAVMRGKNSTSGIGVVEVYDLSQGSDGQMANISSRGFVETGDNALFGGFIVGSQPAGTRILARGIGPSLKPGIPNALNDPTIEIFDGNGTSLGSNDNWKESPDRAEIESTGIAPKDDAEAAVIMAVQPAPYTAIVRGKGETTGVGLVEIYNVPRSSPAQ